MNDSLELGQTVKDRVTGFTGVLTAICEYLYASKRVEISATKVESDGTTQSLWVDAARIEII